MMQKDLLFSLGRPFGPLYGAAMSLRELFYHYNVFRSHRLPVPVISVGNLTMGGTGKTPMVSMLAKTLRDWGYHPAIISRGYRGTASGKANTISKGMGPLLSVKEAGDEPFLLATTLEDVVILTGKKRIFPAQKAVMDYQADILILDDGFQHMAIRRDINIVLFNSTTLAGNSRIFPAGDLREPIKSLRRADIFVLTGVNDETLARATAFAKLLESKFPAIPVYYVKNFPPRLYDYKGQMISPGQVVGPVVAFSGIAEPQRFFHSLKQQSISLAATKTFGDHVNYEEKELYEIRQMITKVQAGSLITTLKDQVKLKDKSWDIPLYYLDNETEPAASLLENIKEKLHAKEAF